MKKFLVTGCLGYIGTEICELLSDLSWKYDIHGIDNKFFSSRVPRLRIKNIKYDQIDILDEIKIQKSLKNYSLKI
jgi:UDP-glucose 4-epimerase